MWEMGDRVLWVLRGDRCLMWGIGDRGYEGEGRSLFGVGNRRSGFVGVEGAIAALQT